MAGTYGQLITNHFAGPEPGFTLTNMNTGIQIPHMPNVPHMPNALNLGAGAGALARQRHGRPRGILRTVAEVAAPIGARYVVNRMFRYGRNLLAPQPPHRGIHFNESATRRLVNSNMPTRNARRQNTAEPTRVFNESRWNPSEQRSNGTSRSALARPPQLPRNGPQFNGPSGAARYLSSNQTRLLNHNNSNLTHREPLVRGLNRTRAPINAAERAQALHNERSAPPAPPPAALPPAPPAAPRNGTASSLLSPPPPPADDGPGLLARLFGAMTLGSAAIRAGVQPNPTIKEGPPRHAISGGRTRRVKKTRKSKTKSRRQV